MRCTLKSTFLLLAVTGSAAFTILPGPVSIGRAGNVLLKGYLDDLAKELNGPSADPDLYADSKEATDYDKSKIDRYGPGSFEQYVVLCLLQSDMLSTLWL